MGECGLGLVFGIRLQFVCFLENYFQLLYIIYKILDHFLS